LKFSWDSQRLGEEIRIMARFDKVYIAKGLSENQANRIAHIQLERTMLNLITTPLLVPWS
jgi:hypothetical protein